MMFLDCPAYLDQEGALRCGLPAEVRCRFTMRSTDGPVESAMIRCPAGHYFCGAIESLTWDRHDGRHDGGGSRSGDVPAEPERDVRRPNTAPAYYLGRPARLYITAIRPRRRRTAPNHPEQAVTGAGERTPFRHGGPLTGGRGETARVTSATTSLPVRQARRCPDPSRTPQQERS